MNLQAFSEDPVVTSLAVLAASAAEARLHFSLSQQDFCSALYRDPDLIGLYGPAGLVEAHRSVESWRSADVKNLLMVLLPAAEADHLSYSQVLNAGADDVQLATIDPQELSARLKALCARVRPVSNISFEFLGCTFNPQQGDLPRTVFDGLAREHSRKPEEFYALCDRILPHARHCDVFARERRPGLACFRTRGRQVRRGRMMARDGAATLMLGVMAATLFTMLLPETTADATCRAVMVFSLSWAILRMWGLL